MSGKNVLCFGELLLRLCPDATGEWLNKNTMPVYIGGAEANVATALAKWNIPVQYLTALPDNYLSSQALKKLSQKKIDTSKSIFYPGRFGTYYLPQGSDVKHAGVIYDRAASSFSLLKPGVINWDEVFKNVDWFHLTAICPAVSESAAGVCLEAVRAAKRNNIKVSIDLNYRAKLWQYGKKPVEVMPQLVEHCDLVMGNIWAAEIMLGVPIDASVQEQQKALFLQQAEKTSREIIQKFPSVKTVANTFRFGNDRDIAYYTTLFSGGGLQVSTEYYATEIIDKVGSGDCFMAGLIYGILSELGPAQTLGFATAAAYNMLFTQSDSTDATVNDIQKIIDQHAKA